MAGWMDWLLQYMSQPSPITAPAKSTPPMPETTAEWRDAGTKYRPQKPDMSKWTPWQKERFYKTGASEEPGSWFWMNHPTHSDWYSLDMASKFADAAKSVGVDPWDFVALGISESGLGNQDYGNPTRLWWKAYPEFVENVMSKIPDSKPEEQQKAVIGQGAKILAEKIKEYPNDRTRAIQAYSGKGKTIYGGHPDVVEYQLGTKKVFGKDYRDIDFWRDMPQGKRVVTISDILKSMPELQGLISK